MKKQILLTTKSGLVYAIKLDLSLVTGVVTLDSSVKTAQLFGEFKPCMEKTLSVKAESGNKKYLISLVKADDGDFQAVIDDITLERVKPQWQIIAGRSKLTAVHDRCRPSILSLKPFILLCLMTLKLRPLQ